MQASDPRVSYYAAGILTWVQLEDRDSFAADDPASWRFNDPEADPFGDHGHYLRNRTLLILGLELLVELQVLTKITDRYGPEMYSLAKGHSLRSVAASFSGSPFDHANRFGPGWITKALDRINLELAGGEGQLPPPPGQDDWDPLQLDLSNPDVSNSIEELDKAIKAIASDNGFSVQYPVVRDAIVADAAVTLERIRAGKATRGQVWKSMVSAGRWVAEKFSGSAIGAVGSELVKWALRLLGLPL